MRKLMDEYQRWEQETKHSRIGAEAENLVEENSRGIESRRDRRQETSSGITKARKIIARLNGIIREKEEIRFIRKNGKNRNAKRKYYGD